MRHGWRGWWRQRGEVVGVVRRGRLSLRWSGQEGAGRLGAAHSSSKRGAGSSVRGSRQSSTSTTASSQGSSCSTNGGCWPIRPRKEIESVLSGRPEARLITKGHIACGLDGAGINHRLFHSSALQLPQRLLRTCSCVRLSQSARGSTEREDFTPSSAPPGATTSSSRSGAGSSHDSNSSTSTSGSTSTNSKVHTSFSSSSGSAASAPTTSPPPPPASSSTLLGEAQRSGTGGGTAAERADKNLAQLTSYEQSMSHLLTMLADLSPPEQQSDDHRVGLVESIVKEKRCVSQVQEHLAMFDVHLQNGNINLAEEVLYTKDMPITTDKFNQLLKLCAKQCFDLRSESIYNNMLRMNVPPDATTYALLLLSIRHHDSADAISQVLQLAADMGFTHEDLLQATVFATDNQLHYQLKQQLHRVGLANVTPPRQHLLDMEKYNRQWCSEASLGVSLDAIPTRSTQAAFEEYMQQPHPHSETDMSSYHIWIDPIAAAIEEKRHNLQASPRQTDAELAWKILYNSPIDARAIATAVLSVFEYQTAANPYGCKMNSLVMGIGRAVYRTYCVSIARANGPSDFEQTVYARYHQIMSDPEKMRTHSPAKLWRRLAKEYSIEAGISVPSGDEGLAFWTPRMLGAAGGELVDLVLQTAKTSTITGNACDEDTPAFYHTYEFEGTKRYGFIRTHELVQDYSQNYITTNSQLGKNVFRRSIDAVNLPMVVLPKPWITVRSGANLVSPVTIMRTFDANFHHFALLAETTHLLDDMFDALTYLSSTPWRVNEKVVEVVREVFKSEVGVEALAVAPHEVSMPERKSAQDMTAEEKAQQHRQMVQYRKQSAEAYSQRTTLHLKLMVAQALADSEFYLPHNLDFRGRAYTIAPYLTHIGDDLSRGLLVFAEKKPLGKNGLRWLKIHLANVYGNDKCSLDDRVKFAEENMANVEETVRNPLKFLETGESMWWLEGDNPWQILAICSELYDAANAPNPEEFESGFPVHQDGTCNGLQHYAALGRDVEGARHVNLVRVPEDDRPQDVYSAVARTIDTHLQRHAEGDFSSTSKLAVPHDTAQEIASVLVKQGPMKRKIVKQTVMTNVYGVTFVGGREQIARQLKVAKAVPPEKVYAAASYLTSLVFLSLGEIFEKAQLIQQWLSNQAKKIAASGEPVAWVTPLGMPVVQPYHNTIASTFSTNLQTIWLVETGNPTQLPAVGKQGSAFPPNFVHSLDSTHMMMTANACRKDGVAFASVHDSYWTHASTVDQMSKHTREQFVNIHSRALLKDLYTFFKLQYEARPYVKPRHNERHVTIDPCPEQGDFDINEVLNSTYFFS